MRFLNTRDITITYSNAPSESYPEWDSANTPYAKDDVVIYNNHIWTSLVDDNSEEPGAGLNWFDEGVTNMYKCIDQYINTQTTNYDEDLVIEFNAESINAISLFNITGTQVIIEVYDSNDVLVVSETVDLVSSVSSWEDYFLADLSFQTRLLYVTPIMFVAKVKVTIVKADYAGVGMLLAGKLDNLGLTLAGVTSSIDDYSKKEVDDNGNVYLQQGNFADRLNCKVLVYKDIDFNTVRYRLTQLRATPTVWVADEEDKYKELLLYGYYESFSAAINNAVTSEFTLDLRGLI